ncbi:ATP-grasp domain-containing protein [Cohnella hashimotonis]|uniref:ATP-grasp domain-containing protein n=1 Tax=Cohnella hashimotonis TaxID=2826895 RepID=A0ABT6TD28_9BACL|nr:ATP-grasp domain-containing protein [Cohnella hashimotonis]MDI4644726.1 ATP-grasp domain-containing protein [Cohnella hashimotonis]
MIRIYMNRWFSTAYHYIRMIRDNPDGETFRFYGTHPDIQHLSLLAADHRETEPPLLGEQYAQFCADYCRRHEIDLFIPRLHMEEIARHIHLFDEVGTRVMVCRDLPLLDAMTVKDRFYEKLRATDVVDIPAYEVVDTPEAFKQAYERLSAEGHRICFKPTKAEGGMGFRIIDNNRNPLADLYGYVTLSTSFEQAYSALSAADRFDDLMVMEWLEGPEYSIDCLASAAGELLAAIPRRKSDGRKYVLESVPELLDISNKIAKEFRIPYAFNIQVRYNNGIPKLLEINPRMSGGLYISCLSGVNLPYLAVKAALGRPVGPVEPQFGITASYIEHPLVLR